MKSYSSFTVNGNSFNPLTAHNFTQVRTPYQDFDLVNNHKTSDVDFFTKVISSMNNSDIQSGCMPPGVRFHYPGIVVFERPPAKNIISYLNYTLDEMTDTQPIYDEDGELIDEKEISLEQLESEVCDYYIPIPWQLYIVMYSTSHSSKYVVNHVQMYFMNTSLTSPDVQLYTPYIPNFFLNGSLCAPKFDYSEELYKYPKNISGVIASAYDWVWNTGFNRDLVETVEKTISTPNLNPLVQDYYSSSFNRSVGSFYKYLSQCSLEDVASYPWLNPAYANHYGNDSVLLYDIPDFRQEYHHYLFKTLGVSSIDQVDSSYLNHSAFGQWYGDTSQKTKTFADIINFLFEYNGNYGWYSSALEYFKYIYSSVDSDINFDTFINTCSRLLTTP